MADIEKDEHLEVELNAEDVDVTAEDMAALEAVRWIFVHALGVSLLSVVV